MDINMEIKNTERTQNVLKRAHDECVTEHNEFITPEHLLMAMILVDSGFYQCLQFYTRVKPIVKDIEQQFEQMPKVVNLGDFEPDLSMQMQQVIEQACLQVVSSNAEALDVSHLAAALLQLEDSWAAYIFKSYLDGHEADFLKDLVESYERQDNAGITDDDDPLSWLDDDTSQWQQLVTCLNDVVDKANPLIGRERELERTIQVLCRKDKNNPLHVGEPGVGKTALVYGLTRRIVDGKVPERLQDSKVYMMDMGTMLAGTQYRGDFERRIQQVMDGVQKEGKAIVYIDEIHNMIGAGSNDGTNDASNMLKPYLERGDIRFIGSTTYDEYNRYFSKSKGIVRRFQQIDIAEPSVDETIEILKGLRQRYEEFHQVTYSDEVIEYAVRQSAKYISDRFLPDKAIDLIDEAGAAHQLHQPSSPITQHPTPITQKDIQTVLEKTCKIDAAALKDDNNEQLETLGERILSRIYGQDEAVRQVVEAIQMSKAGLSDDDKPLASLLFVGPTGVGKTEVARVLAQELGIELVRFDMSEYTEKHAVAKLIGSPAGYVGYEDGGQLTDAIRKSPNCVLLLDELEKAHQDIYNILLQVMDYARLTDNKGRKADFRNVVVIMTSNAGAQYAGQTIGFERNTSRGEAMLKQVKRLFKPEFINRLSGTVVFRDMDLKMAGMILDKKLSELQQKLSSKKVSMTLTDDARQLLLKKGFTHEYGAREMDRVIAHMLKPLLMREILFGSLRQGGNVTISTTPGQTLCLTRPTTPTAQPIPQTVQPIPPTVQ